MQNLKLSTDIHIFDIITAMHIYTCIICKHKSPNTLLPSSPNPFHRKERTQKDQHLSLSSQSDQSEGQTTYSKKKNCQKCALLTIVPAMCTLAVAEICSGYLNFTLHYCTSPADDLKTAKLEVNSKTYTEGNHKTKRHGSTDSYCLLRPAILKLVCTVSQAVIVQDFHFRH